jgi:hypothetical protein
LQQSVCIRSSHKERRSEIRAAGTGTCQCYDFLGSKVLTCIFFITAEDISLHTVTQDDLRLQETEDQNIPVDVIFF